MTATTTRRTSLTCEPLLLNTERLHRVDASQLPQGAGVALGYCRTDMGVCMGHPACADTHCPGHPCNDAAPAADDQTDEDGPMQMLAGLLLFAVVFVGVLAIALS